MFFYKKKKSSPNDNLTDAAVLTEKSILVGWPVNRMYRGERGVFRILIPGHIKNTHIFYGSTTIRDKFILSSIKKYLSGLGDHLLSISSTTKKKLFVCFIRKILLKYAPAIRTGWSTWPGGGKRTRH